MKRAKNKGTFLGVLHYLKPYRLYLTVTVVLALVTVAMTLAVP